MATFWSHLWCQRLILSVSVLPGLKITCQCFQHCQIFGFIFWWSFYRMHSSLFSHRRLILLMLTFHLFLYVSKQTGNIKHLTLCRIYTKTTNSITSMNWSWLKNNCVMLVKYSYPEILTAFPWSFCRYEDDNSYSHQYISQDTVFNFASVYYLVEMATSTLHLKSSIVGRWGSFREVAASRAARLKIQREIGIIMSPRMASECHSSSTVQKFMDKSQMAMSCDRCYSC